MQMIWGIFFLGVFRLMLECVQQCATDDEANLKKQFAENFFVAMDSSLPLKRRDILGKASTVSVICDVDRIYQIEGK